MKRIVLLAFVTFAFVLGTPAQRLPENVSPESYDLRFEPNLSSATFSGDETIHVRVQKPASSIILNSAEIKFQEATIAAGGCVQTASVSLDDKNETAVKNQDLFFLQGSLADYETRAAALELFKTDFQALLAKAGPALRTGFPAVAGFFCDEKLRDDSQQFFAAQKLPGSERPLQNAKDQVNACIALRSLQQANLFEYLKKWSAPERASASR
jgi:Peptidase M1 N-terminal domain